jgi:hypothetical protein
MLLRKFQIVEKNSKFGKTPSRPTVRDSHCTIHPPLAAAMHSKDYVPVQMVREGGQEGVGQDTMTRTLHKYPTYSSRDAGMRLECYGTLQAARLPCLAGAAAARQRCAA